MSFIKINNTNIIYNTPNLEEEELIYELCALLISSHYNTYFKKRPKRIVTTSEGTRTTRLLTLAYPGLHVSISLITVT